MQSMSSFSLFVQARKFLQDSEESQSSAPMTDQGSPDFTNAGFTSSLLVVTGSLLLSILCVLVFNALFRCILLYRRWRMLSEASPNMDVQRAQSGFEKKDLEALPATVYHTGHPLRALDCPTCLQIHGRRKASSITRMLSQFPRRLHRDVAGFECFLSYMSTLSPLRIVEETDRGSPARGKCPNGC